MPTRLASATLDAAALVSAHPPRLSHPHKRLVFEIACPVSRPLAGTLTVSRWRADSLPTPVASHPATRLEVRPGLFTYEPEPAGTMAWHVNFADYRLFYAYGSPLFAQDEMQVAEHPALASVCEYLATQRDTPLAPFTRDAAGVPTPVLVRGVERRCVIATDPDVDEDRPYGLYGNRFARAKPEAIRRATRAIVPPTVSHVLAIHAPPGGRGRYTLDEIRDVLLTAYTGFAAAAHESREAGARECVVHSGHWGTGAFGGHRVLMALLQLAAARLSDIDAFCFHAVDDAGAGSWREARGLLDALWPVAVDHGVDAWLRAVEARGFEWGVSDGN